MRLLAVLAALLLALSGCTNEDDDLINKDDPGGADKGIRDDPGPGPDGNTTDDNRTDDGDGNQTGGAGGGTGGSGDGSGLYALRGRTDRA